MYSRYQGLIGKHFFQLFLKSTCGHFVKFSEKDFCVVLSSFYEVIKLQSFDEKECKKRFTVDYFAFLVTFIEKSSAAKFYRPLLTNLSSCNVLNN